MFPLVTKISPALIAHSYICVCIFVRIGVYSGLTASAARLQVEHMKWFVLWIMGFTALHCGGLSGMLMKAYKIATVSLNWEREEESLKNAKGEKARFSLERDAGTARHQRVWTEGKAAKGSCIDTMSYNKFVLKCGLHINEGWDHRLYKWWT